MYEWLHLVFFFALPGLEKSAAAPAVVVYGGTNPHKESLSCPCLTSATPPSQTITGMLKQISDSNQRHGLHKNYGLEGCKKYDSDLDNAIKGVACKGRETKTCEKPWCYVDPERCDVNQQECAKTWCYNNTVRCRSGDEENIFCRSRPSRALNASEQNVLSSSETCGVVDDSNLLTIWPEMAGSSLYVGWLSSPPWNFAAKNGSGIKEGILQHYYGQVFALSGLGMIYSEPALSQASRDRVWIDNGFNSSWSSCVYDLAVGRLDFCMADFWVTANRLKQCNFLPLLYRDEVFLVEDSEASESLFEILQKPFLPFAYNLWAFVMLSLCVMGVLVAWAETGHNPDDYPDERCPMCFCKGIFTGLYSYFTGGVYFQVFPKTIHGMCFSLGVGFFVLLSLSTYTANLASFLILKKVKAGVNTLEEAVLSGETICVSNVYAGELSSKVPALEKVWLKRPWLKCVLELHKKRAGYAAITLSEMDNALRGNLIHKECKDKKGNPLPAGVFSQLDPKGNGAGQTAETKDLCPADAEGNLDTRRDCFITKVGDGNIIHSLDVACASTHTVHHPVSFGFASAKVQGLWSKTKVLYEGSDRPLQESCPAKLGDAMDRMKNEDMFGTSVASMMFVTVGWGFMLLRIRIIRRILRAILAKFAVCIPAGIQESYSGFSKRAGMLCAEASTRMSGFRKGDFHAAGAQPQERAPRLSFVDRKSQREQEIGDELAVAGEKERKREKEYDDELENVHSLVNSKLLNKLNLIVGNPTRYEEDEIPAKSGLPAAASAMQEPLPSSAAFANDQLKQAGKGSVEGCLYILSQLKKERSEAEALWQNVAQSRLENQLEWVRLESQRNASLGDSARVDCIERTMLDGQWTRLRKERDQLNDDLKEVRGLQKECISMWGDAERYLLRSKLVVNGTSFNGREKTV